MDWKKLVDELMKKLEITTDQELALYLGAVRTNISNWRTGRSELGSLSKMRIIDGLGYIEYPRELVLELLPSGARAKMIELDRRDAEIMQRKGE